MSLQSIDFYKFVKQDKVVNPNYGKTHMFDVPFRLLVVGPSGSGKSQTALDIIAHMPSTFCKIIICCKTKDEPLYNFIAEKLKDQVEFWCGDKPAGGRSKKTIPNLPNLDDISEKDDQGWIPKVIIFDDLVCDDQEMIAKYAIRCRKKGISFMFLTQSYFGTYKNIRLNVNYIVLKRGVSERDLKCILRSTNIPLNIMELVKLYRQCTKSHTDYFLLDIEKMRVYCNTSLEPLYDGYADDKADIKEEQPTRAEIYQEKKEKYLYNTKKILGMNHFIKSMVEHYAGYTLPYRDIHGLYKDFCEKNDFETAGFQMLSKHLMNHCRATTFEGKRYYYIPANVIGVLPE